MKTTAAYLGGTWTDKAAEDLVARCFQNTRERLALWKKSHRKLGNAVSPVRAAQFLLVEHHMASSIDPNIAAEMPVVGAKHPVQN